ncbi:MAG: helix-turn-helix domain-containing protein [Anaerolineales bacterium]|nr:helix-turn-helix domain-containing protein [Anaerolineales bacterium]
MPLPPPETQLAYLGFQRHNPHPFLRPYVQSYWSFRRATPLAVFHEEYMHPTGGFGIVFNFGDTLHLDTETVAAPVFLDGSNTVSRKMGFQGQVEVLGVRFHEGGAYPFLGIPMHELRNAIALLDALNNPELLEIHARLQEAKTLPAQIRLLDEWLLAQLVGGKEQNLLIPASLKMQRTTGGQLPIPELAQELAISQRQLERLYQHQVGMSPKQYAQLQRVENARVALKKMRGQTTTRLGLELGFYDQAHFIREFSDVVGITPYAYLKRGRIFPKER